MELSRREIVKTSVAAALLSGVPVGWRGSAYASDAPETPKVRIGIIALTDCSSIVMAHELGLFRKHGIESTISKEASGVETPREDMKKETLFDGVTFDPAEPEKYAKSFAVHTMG